MNVVIGLFSVLLKTGLIFSVLAMGYYVTYTLLDFPDLTVEGTFLTGAAVWGLLATAGVNPWIGIIAAFIAGAAFGAVTGLLHVKFGIRPLLCGILVSTCLITVNLVLVSAGLMGDFSGSAISVISVGADASTFVNTFPFALLPAKVANVFDLRKILLFAVIALLCKILLDRFLKTKRGLLLRATGDNAQFVRTLAQDQGKNTVLGLAIGNGLAAVSGVMYASDTLDVNQSMGVGCIVIGLASLIIGLSVLSRVRFLKDTTKVIIGAVLYQACLSVVTVLGVPSAYNKLIMAVIFVLALILSAKTGAGRKRGARNA